MNEKIKQIAEDSIHNAKYFSEYEYSDFNFVEATDKMANWILKALPVVEAAKEIHLVLDCWQYRKDIDSSTGEPIRLALKKLKEFE